MIDPGTIVDAKYRVDGLCSDGGGMGTIVFVTRIDHQAPYPLVLKYCREEADEFLTRFRREVRLLQEFQGNSRVVEIVDANLGHSPPYFVMRYYPEGDLTSLRDVLPANYELQERVFNQMIDCVGELHRLGKLHRDIKPQNFLRDGDRILVSDFGLSTELESKTAFTRSSAFWGTHGYLPPEFHHGGFKHADASGDVFMLGKSFYVLLSGRDPLYLVADDIPEPLFVIIERCCATNKAVRYQTLSSVKQGLAAAYDVLLGRANGAGKAGQLLEAIRYRLKDGQFSTREVRDFIEQIALLDGDDQVKLCFELDDEFFRLLGKEPIQPFLNAFLTVYRRMVDNGSYGYSYAETIALRMQLLFDSPAVSLADKTAALELAIIGAYRQNRFAAMDLCETMIANIVDEHLAIRVREMLVQYSHTFVAKLEPSKPKSDLIRRALAQLKDELKPD